MLGWVLTVTGHLQDWTLKCHVVVKSYHPDGLDQQRSAYKAAGSYVGSSC
jgi:hypothetical protein